MSLQYAAFTLEANNRMRTLITEVDIGFSESVARVFGKTFVPTRIKALWDTGASTSSVSGALADRIGLPAIDYTTIHGAGGIHDSRVFSIDLIIPGTPVRFNAIQTTEFVSNGFDMLVGMDIITQGDFSVTNAGGRTVFSFRVPSDSFPIDYVAMSRSGKASKAAVDHFKKKQRRH